MSTTFQTTPLLYESLCRLLESHIKLYTPSPKLEEWKERIYSVLALSFEKEEKAMYKPQQSDAEEPEPIELSQEETRRLLKSLLFLYISTHTNTYTAHTRIYLAAVEMFTEPRPLVQRESSMLLQVEAEIAQILQHSYQIQKEENQAEHATKKNEVNWWRRAGIASAAIGGGVLVGVTGGLAAPLVGAGLGTVLGAVGVGSTAAGALATGLAGSGVVMGSLFGAYGAKMSGEMIERHTKEIDDFKFVNIKPIEFNLHVTICISGWLKNESDITEPWRCLENNGDLFALQWEVQPLLALGNALTKFIKSKVVGRLKFEIIKRTILASLMSSLWPIGLLQVGAILDNPWMNAKALALKAGRVLGNLIAEKVHGERPLILCGYSLGALVIFEALKHLATLSKSADEYFGIIQDVYLFGLPASCTPDSWKQVRQMVSGRLINGYASKDLILGILFRTTDISWGVAGLQPVNVNGIENIDCGGFGINGHTDWRTGMHRCLKGIGVEGVLQAPTHWERSEVQSPITTEADSMPVEGEDKLVSPSAVQTPVMQQ